MNGSKGSGYLRAMAAAVAMVGFFDSAPAHAAVPPGAIVGLKSVNYPDHFVRHRNGLGEISKVVSELDQKDASFVVRPGLAGQGVSFESVNFPGYFLRHQNAEIKLHKREDSALYKKDATFVERPGVTGKGVSFESVNFPGFYLRHCSAKMFIDNNKHGNKACDKTEAVYKADVSFEVVVRQ